MYTVLDGDGEIVRTAPHMDVRRVVVEGVDVNQYALYNEYRAHVTSSSYCLSATKIQNLFDYIITLLLIFPFFYRQAGLQKRNYACKGGTGGRLFAFHFHLPLTNRMLSDSSFLKAFYECLIDSVIDHHSIVMTTQMQSHLADLCRVRAYPEVSIKIKHYPIRKRSP